MAIVFDIPTRFDTDLADEGVVFEVESPRGDLYGKFKCRLMDQDSTSYRLKAEKINKEMERANRNAKTKDRELMIEVFVRAIIVDWSDVKAGGKDVPFSVENARAYFNQEGTRYVVDRLFEECRDAANFEQHDKVEVTKN